MELEKIIQIFIYVHAGLGGVALIAGAIALFSKKGRSVHRKAGKIFFYSMLSSAITALIIAVLPNHENPFLFVIGIFSTYFILTGYRALRFKGDYSRLLTDRIISWIMIITGIAMILYPIILSNSINIILTVFGIVGLVFAIRDIRLYNQPEMLKKVWLKLHLGKMTGGYIAAMTAFVVVNQVFPGIYNWFLPGILGGIYITFWMRKLR